MVRLIRFLLAVQLLRFAQWMSKDWHANDIEFRGPKSGEWYSITADGWRKDWKAAIET